MMKTPPNGLKELIAVVAGASPNFPGAYRIALRKIAENEDFDWNVRFQAMTMMDRLITHSKEWRPTGRV